MVLIELVVVVAAAAVASGIAYAVTRQPAWAAIAAALPDVPATLLGLLGAANLGGVQLFAHTAGFVVIPLLLALVDILLIEVGWLRYVTWMPVPSVKKFRRVERATLLAEHYHVLPRPARLVQVMAASVIGVTVHVVLHAAVLWV
ncbi:MAG: hypothetical protein HY369_01115 [Candidatus Aenigmarchaeota archaeon]|nr:hypothetical protein [Candidatus Aenigmarchaeota archaeon]